VTAAEERRLRVELAAVEKERDEAVEAHEEMTRARDDVRDEKWDEYLNAKCAELVRERDSLREQLDAVREVVKWTRGELDHPTTMRQFGIQEVANRLDRALSPPDTSPEPASEEK
jgi:uncharacterized coiled-coil DUF342 family protein